MRNNIFIKNHLPLLVLSAVAATPLGVKLHGKIAGRSWTPYAELAFGAVLMLLCVASLVSQSYNPFIYFRF